jgi:ABC-type glycerol-3-phosphate transport system substrate-binding protein
VGKESVIGKNMGWTLDEFYPLWETRNDEVLLINSTEHERIPRLRAMISMNWDSFIDWNTGECYFEGDDFTKLLEFSKEFMNSNFVYEYGLFTLFESLQNDEIMLYAVNLGSFYDAQLLQIAFDEEFTYKGWPSANRKGHEFFIYDGIAMTSASEHKDAAWEFIRLLLMADMQFKEYHSVSFSFFPTNKNALNAAIEEAMTPKTYVDNSSGETVEMHKGDFGMYGKYYAATQEDVDKIMAVINDADQIVNYDWSALNIIIEEAEYYFHGQKTVTEVAAIIQRRMQIYVNEHR